MNRNHRLLCFSILEMESPLRLGSGTQDDPFSDQPVLRDVRNIPFIPGGTLAGAFAATLRDTETKKEWLGTPADPETPPSSLIMDDAKPLPAQEKLFTWPVEIRDSVTLLRHNLNAKQEHHFQGEVVPVGTCFCFFCRYDFSLKEGMEKFKNKMRSFLFSGGHLGGKKNAGGGTWRANQIEWRHLDLTDKEDLKTWLVKFHGLEWQGDWAKLKSLKLTKETRPDDYPLSKHWQLVMKVKIDSGLHMSAGASGLPEKGQPDLTQAVRQKMVKNGEGTYSLQSEFVDYGTAVKGRIRTAMELLLRTYLAKSNSKLDSESIKQIVPKDPTNQSSSNEVANFFGHKKKAGSWSVEEVPWEDAPVILNEDNTEPTSSEHHIKISEFTQQVIRKAKFDFAPLKRGESEVCVSLPDDAKKWQKVLVSYAGRLIALNVLPWGGHASRGYMGSELEIVEDRSDTPTDSASIKNFINHLIKEATTKENANNA